MRRLALLSFVACAGSPRSVSAPDPKPAPDARVAEAPPPPASPGEPEALRGFVAAHNRHRMEHCAPPLAWSPKIAAVAQKWADHLRDAGGCRVLQHSGGEYGENLAAATVGLLTNEAVVDMWYGELEQYNFKKPGFGMNTGHFTQLVWAATRQIGCGVATCGDAEIWVCNYDPPGNVDGEYPANVMSPGCAR
jgi:uncharacterized protein YkwD